MPYRAGGVRVDVNGYIVVAGDEFAQAYRELVNLCVVDVNPKVDTLGGGALRVGDLVANASYGALRLCGPSFGTVADV